MTCDNCICHLDPMGICQLAREKLNKRMKRKILFVDVDDTLIYWFPHYITWLFKKNFESGEEFNTHAIDKMVLPNMYMEFNKTEDFISKREVIKPIYNFVRSCETRGVEIKFVSACGREAAKYQHLALANLFRGTDTEYETYIFDTSKEKIEFINKMATNGMVYAMLLDDKRETCEAVTCVATDSKDIGVLVHLASNALKL